MNQLYIHSVIKVREWDKTKSVEYNRIHPNDTDSARKQLESAEQGKNVLISWLLMVGKRFKGVYQIRNKGDIKV
jgi:hypothetical protein